tara:strand:- start:1060 stop:1191 length:132 start_codon:yes stop_codon:yes gene_type:complete
MKIENQLEIDKSEHTQNEYYLYKEWFIARTTDENFMKLIQQKT